MKRFLVFVILILTLTSALKADEKEDSLNYFVQQFSLAYQSGDIQKACNSLKNTLRLYKEIYEDVSQYTIYAFYGDVYAILCYQPSDDGTAANFETKVSDTTTLMKQIILITQWQ